MSKKLTSEDAKSVIAASVKDLGYSCMKEEQKLVIVNFLNENDVFVTCHEKYGPLVKIGPPGP